MGVIGLSSACYDTVLSVILLWHFLCGSDLDNQNGFYQFNISNYDRQCVEKLESQIF